ncbi:MAG: Pyridoxal phosphate-dependent amino acid decarboxylase [Candidatus Nomurabacteria bacterium GW2011_GWA1_46_11]|uniref:Pyridoxal phosphate-dependent amino acid decarboxylase n=1 Tax=Candidatus Nomurabacteria bacterium GW2011_GWA1_46_11 TaxID=1618732 RepID=A0A0G1QWG4_9BACT|nr:MAG: Pyridoxal phosphate-dependent amino acid decarboxylase [Candidatus Nomurabacteria bacterium GW2011_GWA1_46_11]
MQLTRRWPPKGLSKAEIFAALGGALDENIDYARSLVIGFPGTTPADISIEAFEMFLKSHPNNITTHTSGEGEKGFGGTQALERDAISMVADLLGAEAIDGYITPGGTESNIMGVLLGREYLAQRTGDQDSPCVILTSMFAHYSIRKAAWVLGLNRDEWGSCRFCSDRLDDDKHEEIRHFYRGHRVDLLGTDAVGRISVEQLKARAAFHYSRGVKKFIVVVSEGNIMTGAVDNTRQVGEAITQMRAEMEGAEFFLHVDACYGGFVVPFLGEFSSNFSFHVPEVDSVAIDAHKMGEVPYPGGMFIYREDERKLRSLLGVTMGYVPGETDGTLCGSRPGASAAACYATFMRRGFVGYQEIVHRCMETADYLAKRLGEMDRIEVLPHDLNIVAFRLADDRPEVVKSPKFSGDFRERVKLVSHHYPADFSDPNGHVRMLYKATVMSHVTEERVDDFIVALQEELEHMR